LTDTFGGGMVLAVMHFYAAEQSNRAEALTCSVAPASLRAKRGTDVLDTANLPFIQPAAPRW
jgi:hypothetical protein